MKENKHPLLDTLEGAVESAAALCKENPVLDTPTNAEGVTIVPVAKVSVGIAGGASSGNKKGTTPAGAGVGVTRTPLSLVVIKDGKVELMSAAAPYDMKHALNDTFSKGKELWAKLKSLKKK